MNQTAPTLEYHGKRPGRKSNRDFWRATRFLRPYRKTIAISILCALLTGVLAAGGLMTLIPILRVLVRGQTVQQYVAELASKPTTSAFKQWGFDLLQRLAALVPTDPIYAIATIFCLVLFLGILGSITRFFQEYLSETTAITAINDIRETLYDRILRLPLAYFTKHGTNDLTARLVSDAASLQEGFKTILGKAIQEPITATFALAVALIIDWRLTIFIIIFTPVMIAVIRKLGTKVRRSMRAALEKNASMLGQIESTLTGIRVVKSATAEPFERGRYRGIMGQLQHDQFRMAKYDAWSTPTLELLGLVAAGCVLIFASFLVFRDKSLEPEQLITLMICLVAIAEPLRRISKLNTVIQKGNAAASRIFEILSEPVEVSQVSGTGVLPVNAAQDIQGRDPHTTIHSTFSESIAFDNLTFTYPNASAPALANVSLEVKKGTSVAIVGRNGSGKTTLLSLLPRFFQADSGSIRVDGRDVRDWPLRELRQLIGIVTQEAIIFPGTIAQNIAYANPEAKSDDIVAAAKRASAHDFILAKPNGYDAMLDGLGGQLSGGQRQRINIARAILRDTPILILDEATSQVDAESEHAIQSAIAELMKDRTTFVIAHRFSTILSADVIVVMEAGRIVGQGRHDQLMQSCEVYKQLYERQLVS